MKNKPFMTTGTSFNRLREEIDCERNFCGTYFCDSVTQKLCVLRNKFLRIVSSFCMFSLKIVEFFVRGSIFFIFAEQNFANKVTNCINKFHKNFFRKCFSSLKIVKMFDKATPRSALAQLA